MGQHMLVNNMQAIRLIKPGLVLGLWEKIRKSLYACSQYSVVLPWTAAQVLMCPDGKLSGQLRKDKFY